MKDLKSKNIFSSFLYERKNLSINNIINKFGTRVIDVLTKFTNKLRKLRYSLFVGCRLRVLKCGESQATIGIFFFSKDWNNRKVRSLWEVNLNKFKKNTHTKKLLASILFS